MFAQVNNSDFCLILAIIFFFFVCVEAFGKKHLGQACLALGLIAFVLSFLINP